VSVVPGRTSRCHACHQPIDLDQQRGQDGDGEAVHLNCLRDVDPEDLVWLDIPDHEPPSDAWPGDPA
jgi:hypothetical protein